MTLDRAQQQIVARLIGSTALDHLVESPADVRSRSVSSMLGGSTRHGDVDGWATVHPQGVGWSQQIAGTHADRARFAVFATWSEISDHMRDVALAYPQMPDQWRAHRKRSQALTLDDRTTHPGEWQGVPYIVPRNRHGMTQHEVRAYWHDVHMVEYRALQEIRSELVGLAFPLLADDEPVDLLELLTLQETP